MPRLEDHDCLLTTEEEDTVKQFIDSGIFISLRRKFRSWCMISRSHPNTSKYFKSNAACRNEEIRQLVENYYMIHPFSKLNLYWEFFMFWLFLFQFIVIPIGSSVAIMKRNDFFYQTKVLLDAIHMTDVIKLFFTGYYDQEKSKVIHNFSNVARRYAIYFFFPDVLSCIHLWLYLTIKIFSIRIKLNYAFPLRLLNRLKILRLNRWLRELDLFREYMNYSSYLFKGIKMILLFFVVIFWAFSVHFFVENYIILFIKMETGSREGEKWKDTLFEFYYDATMLIMLVSYGKYDVHDVLEYINSIFFLCFGYALHMFVYAQILQVWTKYSNAENKHYALHKQFKEYMKYKELPVSLRERIFSYFQFKFHKHFFKESDIINMVSPLLKQEILMHVTRHHIERVEFFRHLPENILMKVVAQLKTEIFLPGDIIISAGTTGTAMFFIYHGTVAVYTPSGIEICHLEDGAHFGEIALILSETRVATVVAVTASELFMLRRSDFLAAIEPFPEFKEQLVAVATERMHKTIAQSNEKL